MAEVEVEELLYKLCFSCVVIVFEDANGEVTWILGVDCELAPGYEAPVSVSDIDTVEGRETSAASNNSDAAVWLRWLENPGGAAWVPRYVAAKATHAEGAAERAGAHEPLLFESSTSYQGR